MATLMAAATGDLDGMRRTPDPAAVAAELVVLAPSGVLDADAFDQVRRDIAQVDGPVVIDLTGCMLAVPEVIGSLRADQWDRPAGSVSVVCGRLTGRRLLARSGCGVPVFHDLRDAIQARVLHATGYGRGWT